MNTRNLLKRWPVASYFILVFLFSWISAIALGLGDFLSGTELRLPDVLPTAVVMLNATFVVGIGMTYVTDGRGGLGDLFARMKRWRVGWQWYLALLIFPALILLVQVPLSIWVTPNLAPIFYPIGIIGGLIGGFLEETGWMGFAYPRMRKRFSVLWAAIVLGLIHALWHTAADFLGNYNKMREDWLPYFVGFFIFVVALRIIIVWIYENTQSVLMAQLAHGFSTGFLGVLVPTANTGEIWPVFYAAYSVALWIVAALILIKNPQYRYDQRPRRAISDHSWWLDVN